MVSAIWSLIFSTGLNEFIAPWKTIAASDQRNRRIAGSDRVRRSISSPARLRYSIEPLLIVAILGNSRSRLSASVVLPQPLSPISAMLSCG